MDRFPVKFSARSFIAVKVLGGKEKKEKLDLIFQLEICPYCPGEEEEKDGHPSPGGSTITREIKIPKCEGNRLRALCFSQEKNG